jgi:uncharacterized membrane protein
MAGRCASGLSAPVLRRIGPSYNMNPQAESTQPRRFWPRLRRPRLFAGTTTGIVVYLLLLFVDSISGRLRFILAWDIGVTVALTLMLITLRHASPERMRTFAARQVTGKWTVLGLTVLAASASLVVIAAEVPLIKTAAELEQIARLALVVVTIVLSWALINTIFALHYAHDYYLGASGKEQVSDVQITDPAVRQLAITQGIISFFYATGILALTVNLVAGML